jgi:selT/selW/selH-like putative selenoprotein
LKRELGIEPQLVPGERGVFDVTVDGSLIFSKYTEGRFPSEAEIVAAIRSRTK